MKYIDMPESLSDWQLDIHVRELSKSILNKDFDECSESVKLKLYELEMQRQTAYMIANVAASVDEMSK